MCNNSAYPSVSCSFIMEYVLLLVTSAVKYFSNRCGLVLLEQAPKASHYVLLSNMQKLSNFRMKWESFCFQFVAQLAREFCAFCHHTR